MAETQEQGKVGPMERTLAEVCHYLDGELIGDGAMIIRGVNSYDGARDDDLTFADTPQHLAHAMKSRAAAIIVSPHVNDLQGRSGIRVPHPKVAFALSLELFHPHATPEAGVHATAVLGKDVRVGNGVAIGANVVIGNHVTIGSGTVIAPGVFIGEGVAIGHDCVLDPHVVLYRHTQIGDRVQIHGGSVIGGDGFGYVFHNGAHVKIPQVGNVVIEDDVEIGCNVCVDRATVGSTLIRQGTKIDNLVQVAHNDRIGKHVIMAGQVGLSGSVTVGDYTVMGGRAGVVDHVVVGEHAQIGAASVVTKDVKPHEAVLGFPARPMRSAKRQMALMARLPLVVETLQRLVERVRRLETR